MSATLRRLAMFVRNAAALISLMAQLVMPVSRTNVQVNQMNAARPKAALFASSAAVHTLMVRDLDINKFA